MSRAASYIEAWRQEALQRDAADALAPFREKFYIPERSGRPVHYFTGNSLGLQPRRAATYLEEELEAWRTLAVDGHFEGKRPWYHYHTFFSEHLSRLLGCHPFECVAMGSLTANLHLLLASFYRPRGRRIKILCERRPFPSDLYAFRSQARFHGLDPAEAVVELPDNAMSEEDIAAFIRDLGEELAVVVLGGVHYLSGRFFRPALLAHAAHEVGAFFGLDLAHAVGNVPLNLHADQVDFACWCSYKYLNSGPGAVGGLFVHDMHGGRADIPRLEGWWGTDARTRFRMEDRFDPAPGAEAWQLSNAPVFNMAAHLAALEIFSEAGMSALREKSLALTGFLEKGLRTLSEAFPPAPFKLITPDDPEQRGCQLSLQFVAEDVGRRVFRHLQSRHIVADWREPATLRLAPVPLYNTFADVAAALEALAQGLALE
ncbi:MAG: kynureninase [Flavobacteriales bacterium]|nr:kynureninase [Flavobacteriales bacterium]MDW8431225.1 kynureninase [Flavobacteriales bacterium]